MKYKKTYMKYDLTEVLYEKIYVEYDLAKVPDEKT